ncbi:MAG: hypothetical protein HFI93_00565 [Lachnospiraceae bacterium]|nr:hypothetical protein [Lachnospiraceae bacterium]
MEYGEYDLALSLLPIDKRPFNYEKVVEEELTHAPAVDATVLNNQALIMLTSGGAD